LHRIDPRVKITGALMLTILCFVVSNLLYLLALLFAVQLLLLSTGVSWRTYSKTIWLAARLALIFILLWPFFDHAGEPLLLDLSIYQVTFPGLMRSFAVAIRIILIASGWFILVFTTSHSKMVRGMVKLGLPYDIGLSISIALRYIPHFLGTISQIKEAQRSRGFDMSKGGPIKKARNYIPILIPTVAIALRTAEELSYVLICRGYGATKHRTYFRDIKMRFIDKIVFIAIVTITPIIIAASILRIVPL